MSRTVEQISEETSQVIFELGRLEYNLNQVQERLEKTEISKRKLLNKIESLGKEMNKAQGGVADGQQDAEAAVASSTAEQV